MSIFQLQAPGSDRNDDAAQRDANSMSSILDVINSKEQEKARSMGKPREK